MQLFKNIRWEGIALTLTLFLKSRKVKFPSERKSILIIKDRSGPLEPE